MTLLAASRTPAQDSFLDAETAAIQAAAEGVAEAVVRIELVGVAETEGEVQSDAPSVGTVVDPEGWIIASSQVTQQPAASILIVKPDGSRQTARVVAKDTSRELVLLKTETTLPMAAVRLPTEISPVVGQYAIAVGRVAGAEQPSISVGIISALGRLKGRALQTDARVSPVYYGGPLLDIRGRLVGILVPAMPDAAGADEKAGWYDAGIAFAIPADGIAKRLETMKAGTDIHPGLLGIVASNSDPFAEGTKIDAVRPRSPAARAGLLPNDEITSVGGVPVSHHYEIRQELGRFDAGDEVTVEVKRDGQTLEMKATLAETIPPLELQAVGLYAQQTDQGVQVTGVEPDSAAAKAGILVGDRLLNLDQQRIESLESLRKRIATADPEVALALQLSRGEEEQTVELRCVSVAGALPPLPVVAADAAAADAGKPSAWEISELTLPDVANQAAYYAPKKIDQVPPRGLLLVLLDPGQPKTSEAIKRWQADARRLGVVVAVLTPADERRWTPGEADVVGRVATQLSKRMGLDRASIGVTGDQKGPSHAMALVAALTEKEAISGVAAIAELKPPAIRLRENDPEIPLQLALPIDADAELPSWAGVLPKIGFPIVKTTDFQPGTLLQWVRTLPRL